MIVLDTDHTTVLMYSDSRTCEMLQARMKSSSDQDCAVSIVTAEEQMRGWLAEIKRNHQVHRQLAAYEALLGLFDFFSRFRLLPFDARGADEFELLRKQKVRVGSMDLKIASIALANSALLLSNNLRDFRRVPGLRVESWLDEGDED